ncbi:MAG: MBL fold metallo-hydrolase [bacterium]|nr:MBL fold metallo-hydrolase [bacterium]
MTILTFPLGQLQANCYFIIEDKECLIIDPGDDAAFILEEVQRRNLKVVGLLATHGHFDHIMAVGELQLSIDAPLYIDKRDMFLVERLNETAEYFLGYNPYSLKPNNIISFNKKTLEVPHFMFQVISTPGHTPGSVCFYLKGEGVLFTGDTLFKQGIGRYDFSYSDKKDLLNSITEILKLPDGTQMYPGHGETTTVEDEKLHNPFIQKKQ